MTEREYKNIKDKIRQVKDTNAVLLFLLERVYQLEKDLANEEKKSSIIFDIASKSKSISDNKISVLAKMTHRAIEFGDPGAVQVEIFDPDFVPPKRNKEAADD